MFTILLLFILFGMLFLNSCFSVSNAQVKVGEEYVNKDKVSITVEDIEVHNTSDKRRPILSAVKIRYVNNGDQVALFDDNFKAIQSDTGKMVSKLRGNPLGDQPHKEVYPGDYAPGAILEGYVYFEGNINKMSLMKNREKNGYDSYKVDTEDCYATWTF